MNFAMPSATAGTAGKKLDLSKLTDEEAKHVWKVVQRDFDLRKKEEDRLGVLKTKIEKEDIKRELLGNQSSLTESHCIRCLQAFKFLVNIKRQCLDCQLYVCKSCSRYSKKEDGWVCDPCHMARVLKIGTLEWYHANVRARFKRFGSAKVMRSLFKRLSEEHSCAQSEIGEPPDYDTQSMPDVHNGYENSLDASDYKEMKKTKRLLTVDPFDFNIGCDNKKNSRGQDDQPQAPPKEPENLEYHNVMDMEIRGKESMLPEADMDDVYHPADHEQHDDFSFADNRTVLSRSMSRQSYSSCGSGSIGGQRAGSSFLPGPDDSEAEDEQCQPYRSHPPSSLTSQDSLNSSTVPPQITELNLRMSAIESLLSRLEQKVVPTSEEVLTEHSTSPQWEEVDLEEQQLRQRLHRMTNDISDHSLTSDEEETPNSFSITEISASSFPKVERRTSRIPTRPPSAASSAYSRFEDDQTDFQKMCYSSDSLERKEHASNETNFKGSTALLVELEDKVAQAAARVQNAESEVFYLENRIAALNAAGTPDKKRRQSAIPIQARRLSHNFPTKTSNDTGFMRRRLSIM